MDTNEAPLHLLLDPSDDKELSEPIVYLQVYRYEKNTRVACPRTFKAEEIPDPGALYAMFGGGKYEIIFRNALRNRIVARQSWEFAGKSLPLAPEAVAEEVEEETEVAPPIIPQINAPAGSLLEKVMMLAPLVVPLISNLMNSSRQFQMTMLEQSQQRSDQFIAVMQSMHTAQVTQMTQLMAATAKGGGGNSQSFQDGISWMTEFMEGQREVMKGTPNEEGFEKTLEQVMQGMTLLNSMSGSGPPPATGVPTT